MSITFINYKYLVNVNSRTVFQKAETILHVKLIGLKNLLADWNDEKIDLGKSLERCVKNSNVISRAVRLVRLFLLPQTEHTPRHVVAQTPLTLDRSTMIWFNAIAEFTRIHFPQFRWEFKEVIIKFTCSKFENIFTFMVKIGRTRQEF